MDVSDDDDLVSVWGSTSAARDADVDAVLAVCPDLDRAAVRRDLAASGSVQTTINRALDGQVRQSSLLSHFP